MPTLLLTRYSVTVPRKGKAVVKAYSPEWAAVQGTNLLNCTSKWAWVRRIDYRHKVNAEKVRIYRGIGR